MNQDQLSTFCTILRNAVRAKHTHAVVLGSKLNKAMLDVMKSKGFIKGYVKQKDAKFDHYVVEFNIFKFRDGYRHAIRDIKQVSKPSLRIYKKHNEIFRVQNGKGASIFSTSHGVMEGSESRSKKVGGQHLVNIYS